jgi:hypothetical protein
MLKYHGNYRYNTNYHATLIWGLGLGFMGLNFDVRI